MTLFVGGPVRRREWIAEQYIDHVAWATVEAGIQDKDVTLVFVSHPDDPTNDILEKAASTYNMPVIFVEDEEEPEELPRKWSGERLETMVRVRNLLLEEVRKHQPQLFLSLDSDILLHKKAIREMVKMLHVHRKGRTPVASSHCVNLHPASKQHPNYAMLNSRGNMQRSPAEGQLMPVDVIMAAKLMTPAAYSVDYGWDRRGEDIGWSNAVREKGMSLGWSGRVVSKHCMEPSHLNSVDPRCGY